MLRQREHKNKVCRQMIAAEILFHLATKRVGAHDIAKPTGDSQI